MATYFRMLQVLLRYAILGLALAVIGAVVAVVVTTTVLPAAQSPTPGFRGRRLVGGQRRHRYRYKCLQ